AGMGGSTTGVCGALAAEQKAVEERDDKENARRHAQRAMNTLTDEVLDDLLGRQPQLTEQHREFLKKVLAFHEEFAAVKGDDPETRRSRAEAYYRVGRIRFELGEYREAESAHQEAVTIQKQLVAEFPDRSDYRHELASIHYSLGLVAMATARPDEAESRGRDALALR